MEHLPLKCICGYQSKIDRLEQETEVLREQLRQLGDERTEAADEIERLRTDIEQRAKLMSQIVELLLPFSMLMSKHEQGLLIKAVRGE